MWTEAVRALARVERLQQHFFEPGRGTRQACWEPPVDIFETASGLFIGQSQQFFNTLQALAEAADAAVRGK